jgi:hypothetical protein
MASRPLAYCPSSPLTNLSVSPQSREERKGPPRAMTCKAFIPGSSLRHLECSAPLRYGRGWN